MKSSLVILLFSISICSYAIPKDSLQIEQLKKRIVVVEENNRILIEKINILNTANDKILTAFYTLIGSVVALLTLVTFWNAFQNWKTNTDRLKNIRDALFNDLNKIISDDFDKHSKNNKSDVDWHIKRMESDIIGLYIKFLRQKANEYGLEFHDGPWNGLDTLIELLAQSLNRKKLGYYGSGISPYLDLDEIFDKMISYTKEHPNMSADTKTTIFNAIKSVPSGEYDIHINEIKKNINIT